MTRVLRRCIESSRRAIDSSKNQPNRLRFDRAREFQSLVLSTGVAVNAKGAGTLVLGLQVVSRTGKALSGPCGGIIAYIEVDLDVGDAYILTEALAGRVTVALRHGAAFPIYDKVRVVHGIRPLAHERVVALITTPV